MQNTTHEFIAQAFARAEFRNVGDGTGQTSEQIYSGDVISTLAYAATYFDRDTEDAYEGYYFANKYSKITVTHQYGDTLAVFVPKKRGKVCSTHSVVHLAGPCGA